MFKILGVSVLLLTFVFSGCGRVNPSDVSGTYVAVYSFGTEVLVLQEDSTYVQVIIITGDTVTTSQRGRWSYDPYDPFDRYVELEHALAVQDAVGSLKDDWRRPFDGLVLCGVHRFLPWSDIELQSALEGLTFQKVR